MAEFNFFNSEPISDKQIKKNAPSKNQNPGSMKDRLSIYFCIAFFLIGLFGLQISSLIVSSILKLTSLADDRIALSAYNNFFSYLLTTVVMLIVAYFAFRTSKSFDSVKIGFSRGVFYANGFIAYIVSQAIVVIYSLLVTVIYTYTDLEPNVNANQGALEIMLKAQPVITFITVVFFGPFVEEMAYRLGLFEMIRRHNTILAFVISGLVFGLLHFDFVNCFIDPNTQEYAFQLKYFLNEIINLPSYVISGLVFAYFYNRTGNISSSLFAHVINNFVAATMIIIQSLSNGPQTSFIG